MRKYDKTNKRNIVIVVVICSIILAFFILFMKHVNDMDKKEYLLEANSVLFDADKNMLTLTEDGMIKIKWNGVYYLKYDEENTKLNKQVVVYNNATKFINLYGTIYKINSDESIDKLEDETIIEDTTKPSFYKLDDRKYLLIADSITNETSNFSSENYLIVELDKMGNATLTNNKINMKTLTPTVLTTSTYSFDIANEVLNYNGVKIDLKKIIGSTNLYKEESKELESSDSSSTDESKSNNEESTKSTKKAENKETTSENSVSNSSKNGNTTGGSSEVDTTEETDTKQTTESSTEGNIDEDNKIYQNKNLSIQNVSIKDSSISIEYNLYDPKNEYESTFVEVKNISTGNSNTYYLSKNGTSLQINGLSPNTKYLLSFKYSYYDASGDIQYDSFGLDKNVTTTSPTISVEITKLLSSSVSYTINSNSKTLKEAEVEFYINGEKVNSTTLTNDSGTNKLSGTFNIPTVEDTINYVMIKCTKIVTTSNAEINVNSSLKAKY